MKVLARRGGVAGLWFTFVSMWIAALPATAVARSSEVSNHDRDPGVPAVLDIEHAGIIDHDGQRSLTFTMEVGAPVPASPPEQFLAWNWTIYSNPRDRSLDTYAVAVRWIHGGFQAFVDDNTNPAGFVRTPISSFAIRATRIEATVSLALLGNPTSFEWQAEARRVPFSVNPTPADLAPETGLATWHAGGS